MSMLINISELISTPLKSETFEVPVTMEFYELSASDSCQYRQPEASFEWPVAGDDWNSL